MVGHVEKPDVDAISRDTEVLKRIVCRAGLDDDGGAVLARAKVAEIASVQETLDRLGVGVLSLILGHRRRPG
jgi:hypothetical protein